MRDRSASSGDRRPQRAALPRKTAPRRRGRLSAHVHAVLRRDLVFATVVAIAGILSAVAVFQATIAADDAQDHLEDVRVHEAAASRASGSLEGILADNVSLLARLCSAQLREAAGRENQLERDAPVYDIILARTQITRLQSLVDSDQTGSCAQASASDAPAPARSVSDNHAESDPADDMAAARISQLAADASAGSDLVSITAALLFAVALACLTLVEQLGDRSSRAHRIAGRSALRWRVRLSLAAAIVMIGGVVLLIAAASPPWVPLVTLAVIGAGVAAETWWVRRRPLGKSRFASRWWARVMAAGTVALLAGYAVLLAVSLVEQSAASARADRLGEVADTIQRTTQQRLGQDLSTTAEWIESDSVHAASDQAVAASEPAPASTPADAGQVDPLEQSLQGIESRTREGTTGLTDPLLCPFDDQSLGRTPASILEEIQRAGDVATTRIERGRFFQACDALAAAERVHEVSWTKDTTQLTIALVFLGIGASLLAIAGVSERSARASRILLAVGAAGVVASVAASLFAFPDLISRPRVSEQDAEATQTLFQNQTVCPFPAVVDRLHEQLASLRAVPAVSAELGYLEWFCVATPYEEGMTTADIGDPTALDVVIDDLTTALDALPSSPALAGDLGYAYLQRALVADEEDDRQRTTDLGMSLTYTATAIDRLDETPGRSPRELVIYELNRAAILAAEGFTAEAVQLDRSVAGCIHGTSRCAGRSPFSEADRDGIIVGALADLELLPDAAVADQLKAVLVPTPGTEQPVDLTADVYAQEVQATGFENWMPTIWYWRATDHDVWSVVRAPSLTGLGLENAEHFYGGPVPAGVVLPAGQYRVDLYAGGAPTTVSVDYSAADYTLRAPLLTSDQLGLSAVVPTEWSTISETGSDWHVGLPDLTGGLYVRRIDIADVSAIADGDGTSLRSYLLDQLRSWRGDAVPLPTTDPAQSIPDKWFIGSATQGFAANGAAGQLSVRGWLQSFGSGSFCNATVILAVVDPTGYDTPAEAAQIKLMTRDLSEIFPSHHVETFTAGALDAEAFTAQLPDGWNASSFDSAGSRVLAQDCATGASSVQITAATIDDQDHDDAATASSRAADAVMSLWGAATPPGVVFDSLRNAGSSVETAVGPLVSADGTTTLEVRVAVFVRASRVVTLVARSLPGADPADITALIESMRLTRDFSTGQN